MKKWILIKSASSLPVFYALEQNRRHAAKKGSFARFGRAPATYGYQSAPTLS
jgi:hypothetical protein